MSIKSITKLFEKILKGIQLQIKSPLLFFLIYSFGLLCEAQTKKYYTLKYKKHECIPINNHFMECYSPFSKLNKICDLEIGEGYIWIQVPNIWIRKLQNDNLLIIPESFKNHLCEKFQLENIS